MQVTTQNNSQISCRNRSTGPLQSLLLIIWKEKATDKTITMYIKATWISGEGGFKGSNSKGCHSSRYHSNGKNWLVAGEENRAELFTSLHALNLNR